MQLLLWPLDSITVSLAVCELHENNTFENYFTPKFASILRINSTYFGCDWCDSLTWPFFCFSEIEYKVLVLVYETSLHTNFDENRSDNSKIIFFTNVKLSTLTDAPKLGIFLRENSPMN